MKTKFEELNSHEKQIAKSMELLVSVYTVNMTEERVSRYAEELAECFSPEEFNKIVKQCIRNCRRFPSIAEIIEVRDAYNQSSYPNIIL